MGRLGEEAVYVIAKRQLQTKRHPARTAADAARQVDKQRMVRIHHATLLRELRLQTLTSHRVT